MLKSASFPAVVKWPVSCFMPVSAEAVMTESAEDVTVEVGDGEGGLVKAENQPPVKGESPTQPVVASAVTAAGSSASTPDKSEVRLEC